MKNKQSTATVPILPTPGFLKRCDPRSRLAAFFIMSVVFAHAGNATTLWWLAIVSVAFLPWLGKIKWRDFFLPLWKMRVFFLFLFLLHGFFVPGSALLPFSQWPSTEGLIVGAYQAIHLILMASLALALVRVSSTEDLILGVCGLFGPLEKIGIPVTKWAALLSWTLECVSRLLTMATATRHQITQKNKELRWMDAMPLLSQRTSLFITNMMIDMAEQEKKLGDQGVVTGLPLPALTPYRPGWRDILLVAYPLLLPLVPFPSVMAQ
ncbi:MAG: hypothetical protein HQL64_04445 [Magnetococcales bacterium]|nr:hypothetical protein [Magnetococcales bacterium]